MEGRRYWFDDKECITIDYSKTSLVAGWVRNEIRFIGPRTYLGVVEMGKNEDNRFRARVSTMRYR
jgi:hypothetical protein